MANPFDWPDVEPAPALAVGTWCGDGEVLDYGDSIEVLAIDGAGRMTNRGLQGVPARTACWIRSWDDERDFAQYRSCDLADLDLSEEAWEALYGMTLAKQIET